MHGLILALQFLTRLPTPQVRSFSPQALARSVLWFPLVGLLLGGILAMGAWLGGRLDPWLGALLGVLLWVGVTGALHLDGLGDLADALGASHGKPERFLAVLADPHVGTFAVVTLVLQLLSKLVLLMLVVRLELYALLALVPAWARLGVLWWGRLPPIKAGLGERFTWQIPAGAAWLWLALLAGMSLTSPILLLAPLLILVWRVFLSRRLGGMSGDALGAGVELTESLLLAFGVVAALAAGGQ